MASAADNALKILLKNRKVFTAVYNPESNDETIDFSTGERAKSYTITFTEGAVLRASEVKSLIKTKVVTERNAIYLLCQKITADVATKIVMHNVTYSVKEVIDSFYSNWVLLKLNHSEGVEVRSTEALAVVGCERSVAYVDWLVSETRKVFSTIPDDLVLWPLVGWSVRDALKYVYPVGGTSTSSGELGFKEFGRTSGFTGTGLVDGVAPKKATSYAQTNYSELNDIVDQFNTLMGRL